MNEPTWLHKLGEDYGSLGTVELAPTRLTCVTCQQPLDVCDGTHEFPDTSHTGTVITMLRRRDDLTPADIDMMLDTAQSSSIAPERAVDLYRDPIWAEV